MRSRSLIAGLAALLVVSTSCHDNPLAPTAAPSAPPPALQVAPAALTLDQDISSLITQLFPPQLAPAVQSGWNNIKLLLARVGPKGKPTQEIKLALNALVAFMQTNTTRLTSLLGETKEHALVRLVLDMELYVFSGPNTPPPSITPAADIALGTVQPSSTTQTTIQTPTQHAGVQFPAGSVAEPTTVIVTQVAGNYSDNCSGPLTTHFCQYPQFYRFNVFPDVKLLKPAGVAVCHVDAGTARRPLADHDRFRLAHDKPTDPAAYAPGSTIVDSVEILPIHFFTGLISCTGNSYGMVDRPTTGPGVGPLERLLNRGLNAASRLASAIGTVIAPRDLYAIDQGGGGFTFEFSNFADVDPQSSPDLAMTSPINVSPVTVFPGDSVSFGSWTYTNSGTGTSPTSASALVLASDSALSTNVVTLGAFGTSNPMVPQASITVPPQKLVLPPNTAPGTYFVGAKLDPANISTDTIRANNYWSARIQIRVLRPLVRVCPTETSNGSTVVATIAQALPLVNDSGTVSLCDGTHTAHSVAVTRPVTITSAGPGIAAIDADTAQQALKLGGSTGLVKLHKVKLLHGASAAVDISGSYGMIVIDSSEFDPAAGAARAGISIANGTGTSLTIRANTFVNGDIGVHVAGTNGVTIRRNSFSGQGNAAVLVTDGSLNGPVVIDSSTFSTCARVACVNAFGAGTTTLGFVADTFLVDIAHPVGYAIRDSLPHGTLNVNDNVITATGNNGTDRTLLATYPVDTAAIRVSGTATLMRNKITNTARVFMFVDDGITATASDNVTQHVGSVLREVLPQTASLTLKLNRNDLNDYTSVITGNATPGTNIDLRCNYWGGVAPHNAARPTVGTFQYTPWTAQAIAGTTTACDPSTPFNTIRLCPTGTSSSPTVALMGDALAVVPDNGTVQVCDGTHAVSGIGIFHPVTITAEGPGMPTLDGGALLPDILFVNSVSGTVTIHGLKFTGSKNAQVFIGTNVTGTVTIDHNEFHPFESFPYGSSTTSTAGSGINATGTFGTVNVTNNTFVGGDVGLILTAVIASNNNPPVAGAGGTITATNNTFSTQTNLGLVWGSGGASSFVSAVPVTIHAEGNSFDHCGLFACARVNSMTGGRAEFVKNHFTADISRPTQNGIQLLAGGTALVDQNDFTGTGSGTSTDRTQQSVYPFSITGITVQNMPATVTRNTVTNAWTGIDLITGSGATTPASVTGDHNTLTHVAYPFISGSSTPSTLSWQKNDVTDYVAPTNSPTTLPNADVRCTYWGATAGPVNPPASGTIQYLPWSNTPIATSTTATCDPSVTVNTIRACPTSPGDAILTTTTIANAYVLAPAGGTVLVCEGTFQIPSQLNIQKSITISGEGAAMPTLDGGTSTQNIFNLSGNNMNVTLKSLKFMNGKNHQVFIGGVTGTVLIDHAEFHPVEDGTYAAPTTGNSFAGVGAFGTFGNVTVSNSTFIGGDEGVSFNAFGGAGGTMLVTNNRFTLQTNFSVRWSASTPASPTPNMLFQLTGNTVDNCPREACVRVNSTTGGAVQIKNNHFLADITRPTRVGLELYNATSGLVDHNDFTGSGFGADRTQASGYPFDVAAVQSQTMPLTVTSNTFAYVYSPLNAGTAAITGNDNVAAHVAYPVTSYASPTASVSFSRNDFTDYLGTTNAPVQLAGANLRCNYWGPAGPVNPPNTGTINYLPWAAQPIANTTNACDPTVAVSTIRVCNSAATDGSMTTNSLPYAYALVPANGTIAICDGIYQVPQTLNVQKPVTITGEGSASPTLDGTAAGSNQSILNVFGTGGVTLHQLKLQNSTGHNITISNTTGQVSVDHVEFHPFQSFAYNAAYDPATYHENYMAGIGAFQSIASLTVTNSQFIGGDIGVHVNPNPSTGPSNITVKSSHFTGQSNAGFFIGGGSPSLLTHVEADTFDLCGRLGCAKFFAQGGGRAEWVNNRFVVDIARPANAVINVDGRNPITTLISNNQFIGTGLTGDRTVRASYPIDGAAINGTAPTATISGNSITGAWTAFNATPGTTTVTDNTVSKVFALVSGGGATPVTFALNRSDLSDYVQVTFGTNGFAAMDLRCNYWGSSAGPQNPGNFVNPAPQYLPWSNVPIANQPGVSCNPSVASTTIRVCASPSSDGSMTTNTLMNAYLLVPAGGTISICDGSYPVPQTINIQKSVTIAGEGTALPTLDGTGLQGSIVGVFNTNANVTLRQLKFQNSLGHNVQLGTTTGAILIDHAEFHPMQTYPYDPVYNPSAYHENYQAGVGAFGSVASLLVTNSQFIGGDIGMHINTAGSPGASSITARGNHFTGQSNAGFFVGGSTASLVTRAEADTFDLCGRTGCTKFYANDGGRGEWVNNRFNIDITHPVNTVVSVAGNTAAPISTLMDHNIVTGTGGAGDRSVQSTYPVDGFVFGGTGQNSTITANTVSNAWAVFNATSGTTTANNNVVSHAYTLISGGGPSPINFALSRSDLSDYIQVTFGTSGFASMDLRCNYWGQATGPSNPGNFINPSPSYLPWSTTSIANNPSVSCNPNVATNTLRVCPTAAPTDPPTSADAQTAYSLLPAGGTMRFCDGTHTTALFVEKPMTFTSDGPGTATLVAASGAANALGIGSANGVTIRNLKFQGGQYSNVAVNSATGPVLIDSVQFSPPQTQAYGSGTLGYNSGVFIAAQNTAPVTVQNSSFTGGDIGVMWDQLSNVTVRHNTFTGQTNAGTHGGGGTSSNVLVDGNTYTDCGMNWCVGVFNANGVTVSNNQFTINPSRPTQNPISLYMNASGNSVVTGNTITGGGAPGSFTVQSSFPANSGVSVTNGTATVNGNHVTNAWLGILLTNLAASARDNVVTHVMAPVGGNYGVANPTINRNDFTDYATEIWNLAAFTGVNLQCNWWGGTTGPANTAALPIAAFTPFATVPIAGQTGVSCP